MRSFNYKNYVIIIIIAVSAACLGGCATHTSYFKPDPSLAVDAKTINGVQYLPLIRFCDVYDLECRWDSFIKTATIHKRSHYIILRAGSDRALVDGFDQKLERPVVLSSGRPYIPESFAKNTLGPIVGVREAAETAPAPAAQGPKKFTVKKVIIDTGHGGKDVGAVGRRHRLKEKHIALVLAKKIRDKLEASGIKVVMTRDDDTFIPLPKRAEIANKSGADLFVSVHINASRARMLNGFECYYLSEATDDNTRALEAFENSDLSTGEDATAEHSKQLDKTLWDMALTENRHESAELANYICNSVRSNVAMHTRGVKSARFYVLKYTRMPAVLVESGYISNRYEETKLKDHAFLEKLADAVTKGILKYRDEYEKTEGFTKT